MPLPTDDVLFETFIRAGGEYVSGEALAARWKVSRVSIWNRLEKWEREGFRISAVRHKGYRIESPPPYLLCEWIQALLRANYKKDIPVFVFDALDSTNSQTRRMREQPGCPQGRMAVLTRDQTHGHGRLSRGWFSQKDASLCLTLSGCPRVPLARTMGLSLWLGQALCHFFISKFGLPFKVKWTNDLLVRGRKVAGILTEFRADLDWVRDVLVGIGINLNTCLKDAEKEVRAKAASIAALSGRNWEINEVAAGVIAAVFDAADEFWSLENPLALLPQMWKRVDALAGKRVEVQPLGRPAFEGVVGGLDASGGLCVRRDDGENIVLQAGDVSLKGAYEALRKPEEAWVPVRSSAAR